MGGGGEGRSGGLGEVEGGHDSSRATESKGVPSSSVRAAKSLLRAIYVRIGLSRSGWEPINLGRATLGSPAAEWTPTAALGGPVGGRLSRHGPLKGRPIDHDGLATTSVIVRDMSSCVNRRARRRDMRNDSTCLGGRKKITGPAQGWLATPDRQISWKRTFSGRIIFP